MTEIRIGSRLSGDETSRVLIVDDSPSFLSLMADSLRGLPGVEVDTCLDGTEVEEICRQTQYDLLVVDYVMPRRDGISVILALRARDDYRSVPIVMITSELEREIRFRALTAGATDFLTKPFDKLELQARASNLLALRRAQVRLSRYADDLNAAVRRATHKIILREEEMIWRLARAVEMRDDATGTHVSRVAEMSQAMALDLKLSKHLCHEIYLAAHLHDIGKIGLSDNILCKPGRLDDAERREMQRHVELGGDILGGGSSDLLKIAANIAATHHEKWDGTGYPSGLAGEAIPLEGRIVAVADVFEALCSERPYKRAWPFDEAVREIVASSGRHFDPSCVAAFVRVLPEIERTMTRKRCRHSLSDSENDAGGANGEVAPALTIEFRSRAAQ